MRARSAAEMWLNAEETASEELAKVTWLARLRWVAVVAQLAALPLGLWLGLIARKNAVSFAVIVIGEVFFNLATLRDLRRGERARILRSWGLPLSLAFDLVAVTALLYLSGGVWNPFFPLMFFHAALGALMLSGSTRVGYLALLGASLFLLHTSVIPFDLREFPMSTGVVFPAQLLVAVAIWRMTGWLGDTLHGLNDRIQAMRERRERLDRLRVAGAVAAGFSHELATPLSTLRLRLERALRRSEGAADDLKEALEALFQCEASLRSLNQHRADGESLALQETELLPFLQEVAGKWAKGASEIEWCLPSEFQPICEIPRVPFARAFLDLLDNARETQSYRIEIELAFYQEGIVSLKICDRGPGVPENLRRQLGEPFVTSKKHGTGLGLYNAITLARALGGSLEVRDRRGGGTEVLWTIPLARE